MRNNVIIIPLLFLLATCFSCSNLKIDAYNNSIYWPFMGFNNADEYNSGHNEKAKALRDSLANAVSQRSEEEIKRIALAFEPETDSISVYFNKDWSFAFADIHGRYNVFDGQMWNGEIGNRVWLPMSSMDGFRKRKGESPSFRWIIVRRKQSPLPQPKYRNRGGLGHMRSSTNGVLHSSMTGAFEYSAH